MILTNREGIQQHIRAGGQEWGSSAVPAPSSGSTAGYGYATWAAQRVLTQDATGLPVVAQAINMICDAIGMMPCMVYRREPNEQVSRATKSWQWKLLHDQPTARLTPYWFYSGLARSMITVGNGYALKHYHPTMGVVTDMQLLHARRVRPEQNRETGQLNYFYTDQLGRKFGPWPEDRVIKFVGQVEEGAEEFGISVIGRHRQSLGAGIAQEAYRATAFRNGAPPGLVVKWPYKLSQAEISEWTDEWMIKHGGVENAHKPTILPAGAEAQNLGISLEDMAFVEMSRFTVSEASRMFSVPPTLLGQSDVTRPILEDQQILFTIHGLMPWIMRIEQTLERDSDIFGNGALYPEFLADAMLRPATVARYQAYLQGRQAGWLSVNDIRRMENMPPIKGGDTYQVTPVGGAPNLQPANAGTIPDQNDDTDSRALALLGRRGSLSNGQALLPLLAAAGVGR